MTYGFDGIDLTLQPTQGRWMPRMELGTSGAGHPIYPGVREFKLFWAVMPIVDYDQLRDKYRQVSITGTTVASLPDINGDTYGFKNYSGCTLREPEAGDYFSTTVTEVTLTVMNIQI